MWEDEANKRGGRWLINIERKQRSSDLDRFWLDVVGSKTGSSFNLYLYEGFWCTNTIEFISYS